MVSKADASNYLALDVGDKRIGVAFANAIARLPHPLTTILNNEQVWDVLAGIIAQEQVRCIVVGLPRNLNGDDTAQTKRARAFADALQARFAVEVHLQDEALTSAKAEAELAQKGKQYDKGAIDALAATYILEDYLAA